MELQLSTENSKINDQIVANMVNAQLSSSHIDMATSLGSINQDEEDKAVEFALATMSNDDLIDDEIDPSPSASDIPDCGDCPDGEPCADCAQNRSTATVINTPGTSPSTEDESQKRKQLIKYGAIATAAILLVIIAIKFLK